jgi:hypothetical protein
MKQITLLILNTLSLLYALIMNGLAGSTVFNGKTVGSVSVQYETLFAPAGYAFAIWGFIYLLLIAFVVYQWISWFKHREERELKQTGIWFVVANIANGSWIIAWLNESLGISVLLIFLLLFSLVMLTKKLRLEIWDAPVRIIAFVWWPVVFYLGWIVVASVANVAVYLVSLNWSGGFLSEAGWTMVMIAVATIIYLLLIRYRNMREAALVGVWALIAIAVRQWQQNPGIVTVAVIAAVILFAAISWHGYKNRATAPIEKYKRGEV